MKSIYMNSISCVIISIIIILILIYVFNKNKNMENFDTFYIKNDKSCKGSTYGSKLKFKPNWGLNLTQNDIKKYAYKTCKDIPQCDGFSYDADSYTIYDEVYDNDSTSDGNCIKKGDPPKPQVSPILCTTTENSVNVGYYELQNAINKSKRCGENIKTIGNWKTTNGKSMDKALQFASEKCDLTNSCTGFTINTNNISKTKKYKLIKSNDVDISNKNGRCYFKKTAISRASVETECNPPAPGPKSVFNATELTKNELDSTNINLVDKDSGACANTGSGGKTQYNMTGDLKMAKKICNDSTTCRGFTYYKDDMISAYRKKYTFDLHEQIGGKYGNDPKTSNNYANKRNCYMKTCENKHKNCEMAAEVGLCTSPHYKAVMEDQCPKSCNTCPGSINGSGPKDVWEKFKTEWNIRNTTDLGRLDAIKRAKSDGKPNVGNKHGYNYYGPTGKNKSQTPKHGRKGFNCGHATPLDKQARWTEGKLSTAMEKCAKMEQCTGIGYQYRLDNGRASGVNLGGPWTNIDREDQNAKFELYKRSSAPNSGSAHNYHGKNARVCFNKMIGN
jgi:hypothetical protein